MAWYLVKHRENFTFILKDLVLEEKNLCEAYSVGVVGCGNLKDGSFQSIKNADLSRKVT
jgi:hypothetical protein